MLAFLFQLAPHPPPQIHHPCTSNTAFPLLRISLLTSRRWCLLLHKACSLISAAAQQWHPQLFPWCILIWLQRSSTCWNQPSLPARWCFCLLWPINTYVCLIPRSIGDSSWRRQRTWLVLCNGLGCESFPWHLSSCVCSTPCASLSGLTVQPYKRCDSAGHPVIRVWYHPGNRKTFTVGHHQALMNRSLYECRTPHKLTTKNNNLVMTHGRQVKHLDPVADKWGDVAAADLPISNRWFQLPLYLWHGRKPIPNSITRRRF